MRKNMFKDRTEAGKLLAEKLKNELSPEVLKSAILLAIPRGGIVVGSEISRILDISLDILITKKIPSPDSEELAIGAVGEGGIVFWEEELCQRLNVPVEYKQEVVKRKVDELEQKKMDFRKDKPLPEIAGKTVIITDDGIATGATIKVAAAFAASFSPKETIIAVPVIAKDTLSKLKSIVEKIVYLEAPEMFFSVGQFYESFEQINDEKVKEILGNGAD